MYVMKYATVIQSGSCWFSENVADLRKVARTQTARRHTEDLNAPAISVNDIHHRLDRRRFPGAVRPDQAVDGPFRYLETQPVDSLNAAKPFREVFAGGSISLPSSVR
jgi:hypothetical protein